MKVAYFGYNLLSSCLDYLIQQQHDVVAIFSGDKNSHTDHIWQFAQQLGIKVNTQKPSDKHIQALANQGVECIIAAEYPHKIPLNQYIRQHINYHLNLHPTLLPHGRGQTPIPQLILNDPQFSGLTLHKLSNELDQGDIVLQKPISTDEFDSFDSLSLKMFIAAPYILDEFFNDPISLYENATQQQQGSTWPALTLKEQTLCWDETKKSIESKCRAFASLGLQVTINNQPFIMTSAQVTTVEHGYSNGDVIFVDDFKISIAIQNGIVIIPRSCLHNPE